jgi:glycogen synthase
LQQKYFKLSSLNDDIAVYAFVGRITQQKGVHLILESAETLIRKFDGKVQVLIGLFPKPKDNCWWYGQYEGAIWFILCGHDV